MKKRTPYLLLFSILSLFLCSCGNETETEQLEITEKIDSSLVVVEDDISYTLPSPLQIAFIFKQAGLPYQAGLTNKPENINNYVSKYNQKLNFGVYTADLAYCVLNKQSQEAIYYLKNLGQMSEKLWMSNIFQTVNVLTRFEKNIGNEDSLATIISDMQLSMDNYLEENGVGNNGSIIFAGAWVESMYIGSKVIEKSSNEKLLGRIAEQAIILDNLLKLLRKNNADEAAEMITDLESLQKHFAKFLKEETENEEENESEVEEDVVYTFSKEELQSFGKEIEAIRKKIIN
ncbi:MAG: hypothetical protein HUU48_04565 [Flavobacteriales bacterium]|nr:hypothetical protein [Flavobacteriales bacterium]